MRSIFIKRILFILCLIVNYSFCDCLSFSNFLKKEDYAFEITNPDILSRFSIGSKDKIFQIYNFEDSLFELYIAYFDTAFHRFTDVDYPIFTYACDKIEEVEKFKIEVGKYYSHGGFFHIDFDMGHLNPKDGKPDPKYQAYGVTEYYLNFIRFDKCSTGSFFDFSNNKCVSCPSDEIFDYNKNKCSKLDDIFNPPTESDDKDRPDWCPKPMIFKKEHSFWHGRTISCTPDPNIDEDQCKKIPDTSWSPCFDRYGDGISREASLCFYKYPNGCYKNAYLKNREYNAWSDNLSFITGGLMFPVSNIAFSIGNTLKGLVQSIKSFFKPKPPALPFNNYKPRLESVELTPKGPVPQFSFKPVNHDDILRNNFNNKKMGPDFPPSKPNESYNDYVKRIGLPKDPNAPWVSPKTGKNPTILKNPQTSFEISNSFKKLDLPKNPSKLDDNAFVVSALKKSSKPIIRRKIAEVDHLSNFEIPLNIQTIFENSKSPTLNLPVAINKFTKQGGNAKVSGEILTPDNSIIDFEIIETNRPNGNRIHDINFKYKFDDKNKKKSEFNTGYTITIDNNGNVTNTISKDGFIKDPSTGNTKPNNGSNSNNDSKPNGGSDLDNSNADTGDSTIPDTNSAPDLSYLLSEMRKTNKKLDQINNGINTISNNQKTMWNYKSNSAESFNQAMEHFNASVLDLEVGFKNIVDFVGGAKGSIDNLMDDFNNAKTILNEGIDTPKIPRGKCPFTISGPSPGKTRTNTYTIDPCERIAPFKPILSIFFSMFMCWFVLLGFLKISFGGGAK